MGTVSEQEIIKMHRYFNEMVSNHQLVEYAITEQFTKHKLPTYNVSNVKVYIEDGEVFFDDANNVIWESDYSVLRHFLAESCRVYMENDQIELVFDCGSVLIKVVSVLK